MQDKYRHFHLYIREQKIARSQNGGFILITIISISDNIFRWLFVIGNFTDFSIFNPIRA